MPGEAAISHTEPSALTSPMRNTTDPGALQGQVVHKSLVIEDEADHWICGSCPCRTSLRHRRLSGPPHLDADLPPIRSAEVGEALLGATNKQGALAISRRISRICVQVSAGAWAGDRRARGEHRSAVLLPARPTVRVSAGIYTGETWLAAV
jgi:hypothetical protein